MNTLLRYLPFACLLLIILGASPVGADRLDDILNYAVVDQRSTDGPDLDEGMVMISRGRAKWLKLTADAPVGQTFKLGPKAKTLWRISVGISHWPDSWQEGEAITFTLYDSPEKKQKLHSHELSYELRSFKWDTSFDIYKPTEPGTEYYFELTHNGGGDGIINIASTLESAYPDGTAWRAGNPLPDTDITFVVETKPEPDTQANLSRFLNHFDYTRPELAKAASLYKSGDLREAAFEVVHAFDDHLRSADWAPKIQRGQEIDTTRVDQVIMQGRLPRSRRPDETIFIPINPQTTWREVWEGTADYVNPNGLLWELGMAYAAKGDERYAKVLNDVTIEYAMDNPSPFEGGRRGGQWVAMFKAWRLGDAWDGYALAIDSESFTPEARLAWIDYEARMAHFAINEPSHGNHANAVGEALMQFGGRFPIYRGAESWKQAGFNLLVSNSKTLFHPDGACVEPTMNYHGFSLANLLSGLEQAKKHGYEVPKDTLETTEKALVFTAYMLMPNGQIPSNGDTNTQDFRAGVELWDGWLRKEAHLGWEMFGRKDSLWVSTQGKEGEVPDNPLKGTEFESQVKTGKSASFRFPVSGYTVMRSDWGEDGKPFKDARWLIHYGHEFGSHGHQDLGHISLYAWGRPLLIDPGRTKYGTPLMFELEKPWSHNVLVSGQQQMNRASKPVVHAWQTSPLMDYLETSRAGIYENVNHSRAIVFVRPDYYVMLDRAEGSGAGGVGINFWMTPPDVSIQQNAGKVISNDPAGANILLQVVEPQGLEITSRHGTLDLNEVRDDIPVVTFRRPAEKTPEFTTILYPYPAGQKAPELKVERDKAFPGGVSVAFPDGRRDVVVIQGDKQNRLPETPSLPFWGKAARISYGQDGKLTGIAIAEGRRLQVPGIGMLMQGPVNVANLSVTYEADRVKVESSQPVQGISVAALGRTRAVVNGKTINIEGATFNPFD